jgi:hypothetical protein
MNDQFTKRPQLTFIIRELGISLAARCRLVGEIDIGVESVYTARRLLGLCHRVVRGVQRSRSPILWSWIPRVRIFASRVCGDE